MNINPAASIAGTARAAAKGGESDKQAADATAKQASAKAPGGKSEDVSQLEPGDQAGDRGPDGRQVLDVFERSEDETHQEEEMPSEEKPCVDQDGHLDLEA